MFVRIQNFELTAESFALILNRFWDAFKESAKSIFEVKLLFV